MSPTVPAAARREGRCTVCNGSSNYTVVRENGFEGRACSCGTIYVTPEPLPSEVDATFVGHEDAFYDLSVGFKAAWLRKHTSAEDLLEIGCGTGAFLAAARGAGFDVEGIEADATRATTAARQSNARVRAMFFEDAEIDRRFDLVYHCDMLAHFERPAEALQMMKKFLKPGGVLAFEVGFVADLPLFWYSWIGEIGYPQHRWLYSERSLRKLLEQAGLRIERMETCDLSAYLAFQQALRKIVRLVRRVKPRPVQPDSQPAQPTNGGARVNAGALARLLNILRYRVGAALPSLGPSTALVVARPV